MWEALKRKLASHLVQSYAGSWIRGAMRFLSGALVTHGLADVDLAAALTGSLEQVLMNIVVLVVSNPEVVVGLLSALWAQVWSLREKKAKIKKLEAVEEKANE